MPLQRHPTNGHGRADHVTAPWGAVPRCPNLGNGDSGRLPSRFYPWVELALPCESLLLCVCLHVPAWIIFSTPAICDAIIHAGVRQGKCRGAPQIAWKSHRDSCMVF